MPVDELKMWETTTARHEEEWKRLWEHDSLLGPIIYSRDVVPYKHLTRLARLNAHQPICWGAPDCLDKPLLKCASGKHDACQKHANLCFACKL